MSGDENCCLFCLGRGPFTTVEHIFPESMGNKEWLLHGQICDACQNYFGSEVENFVLNKTVLAWGRLFSRARTKKGKLPRIDSTLPKSGRHATDPERHTPFTGEINSTGHIHLISPDSAPDPDFKDGKLKMHLSFTPLVCMRLAQFSLKAGLEILSRQDPTLVRDSMFHAARDYARRGAVHQKWPLYVRMIAPIHKADKAIIYTLYPFDGRALWFEYEYVGVAIRVNLLHAGSRPVPEGYLPVWDTGLAAQLTMREVDSALNTKLADEKRDAKTVE